MATLQRLLALRAEYNAAVKTIRDISEKAEGEKRGLNTDERTAYDAATANCDALKERIVRAERELSLVAEQTTSSGVHSRGALTEDRGATTGMDDDDDDDDNAPAAVLKREQDAKFQRAFRKAFGSYIRGGMDELTPQQRAIFQRAKGTIDGKLLRDLSVGTAAAGGYTVAQAFYQKLIEAQKAFGGMAEVSQVITTATGATMPIPTESDVTNAATIVGEGVAGNTSVDATFGAVNMGAYMYRTVVRVSLELLQDSAFDVEAYIARKMGIRFARGKNAHFTTGDGSGKPTGITAASGGAATGKTGTTGQTTSVIFNDLVDLEHSVDPAYRKAARWMLHDLSLKVIKKLLDSQNRPIWMPDYATSVGGGFPATLLGYPYTINQDMPQMAANAKSIAFGAFEYYMIREVMGVMILRLTERFADNGQVGFIGFARADGKYVNVNDPIKVYANSAT